MLHPGENAECLGVPAGQQECLTLAAQQPGRLRLRVQGGGEIRQRGIRVPQGEIGLPAAAEHERVGQPQLNRSGEVGHRVLVTPQPAPHLTAGDVTVRQRRVDLRGQVQVAERVLITV